jgi:hypothetical protein
MLAYSGKGKFIVQPASLSRVVEDCKKVLAVFDGPIMTMNGVNKDIRLGLIQIALLRSSEVSETGYSPRHGGEKMGRIALIDS